MALMRAVLALAFSFALTWLIPNAKAQTFGLEYITEWQTNFKGEANWVNLLQLSGFVQPKRWLSLQASTISIAKTRQEPLLHDLQGYSNIEEENTALAVSVLGAEISAASSTLFVGVRNVNEDYFTSPSTSLFTNSSCGIFPTISALYDIANYPLAACGFHFVSNRDKWRFQGSLYNGLGSKRLLGRGNVFRVSPFQDGVFCITSIDYINNGSDCKHHGNYNLGIAVFGGMRNADEASIKKHATQKKTPKESGIAPWVNLEYGLSNQLCLLLQGSFSTLCKGCKYYVGTGFEYDVRNLQFGIFANYADFITIEEIATETTCRLAVSEHLYLQPALHFSCTANRINIVGLIRFVWEI